MYELIQLGEKSYFINSPVKIGVYLRQGSEAYLIDAGLDRDVGRRCRKVLDEKGWVCAGILNTHSHADHSGGNDFLQKRYGCKVFSGAVEAAFTENPVMEPAFLYGGYPFEELRHKFLMAAPSSTAPFTDADFPAEVEILPLPGHCFGMSGFLLPDGTAFIADCLSSRETLDKYRLSFIYDVKAYLETLESLPRIKARVFVPSHAEVTSDIGPLAELNRKYVLDIAELIISLCARERTQEELQAAIFEKYDLTMTYEQYVLTGSTLRSYLSWLKDSGRIKAEIKNNRLVWYSESI